MTPAPFVLLDDARPGGGAWLYRDPERLLIAHTPDEVRPVLAAVRAGLAEGLHAAGYLAYEASAGLEPKLADLRCGDGPLLWFGLFDAPERVDAAAWLPDAAGAWVGAARPCIDAARYADRVGRVLELIRAGDIYQANLTFRATVGIAGDPLAVYAALRARACAGHGAVIATGDDVIVSLSPELFFSLEAGRLIARPMKGTAARGRTAAEDSAAIAVLADDPKQRAENLMIVDLLRNDLARVASPGSVAVDRLFAIETYPTVHQMVSDVTARLTPGCDAVDALAALFPCGSITGAPKLRAMEVIRAIEDAPRGVYTGAIGRLTPEGDARFNVAIRTLTYKPGAGEAVLGLGSGLVADSHAAAEWAECLTKARFLTQGAHRFDLIETMRFEPSAGIAMIDRHLARMGDSARALGFSFDRHAARNELQAATFRLDAPARVRLLLSPGGALAIETAPLPAMPDTPMPVSIVPLPVAPEDFRLRHKTTDRAFYDDARRAAGTREIVFVRADGLLTEGSYTNVFVRRGETLLTPPAALGLLPGVLRAALLDGGEAVEAEQTAADLANGFLLGNSLRGLFPARLA